MGELRFNFDAEKAGQAAAFLLSLSNGRVSKGHLVKMLYAADWSALRKTGRPITGDRPVSMPHGPVLSNVLDLLVGDQSHPFWKKHLSVAPRRAPTSTIELLHEAGTDLLTEHEKKTLRAVHAHFAHRSWDEVKKECYRIFKEWQDPKGSMEPIHFEQMLMRSGKRSQAFVAELVSLQNEKRVLRSMFA